MKNAKSTKRKKQKLSVSLIDKVEVKYFDVLSLANSIGAGSTLFPLCQVPQGATQSERVGDFILPRKLLFNFTLYTVNSDIVTTLRMIFFRWVPSTGLSVPVVADILQSPAASNVLSHFNFNLQDNYEILLDWQIDQAGVPAAPTVTSNIGRTGMSIKLGSKREIEFALGSSSGMTNQIYLMMLSDSSVTPFPILNFSTRLYFEDTIRSRPLNRMVK